MPFDDKFTFVLTSLTSEIGEQSDIKKKADNKQSEDQEAFRQAKS